MISQIVVLWGMFFLLGNFCLGLVASVRFCIQEGILYDLDDELNECRSAFDLVCLACSSLILLVMILTASACFGSVMYILNSDRRRKDYN